MALAVGNDAQFARFAELVGHAEWSDDQRFATNKDRVNNRQEIDDLINQALSVDTAENWISRLQSTGIPCGRINSVAEALETEQAKARRMVETIDHPNIGPVRVVGAPFKFSKTPTTIRRHPPSLGENTEEVLAHGFAGSSSGDPGGA